MALDAVDNTLLRRGFPPPSIIHARVIQGNSTSEKSKTSGHRWPSKSVCPEELQRNSEILPSYDNYPPPPHALHGNDCRLRLHVYWLPIRPTIYLRRSLALRLRQRVWLQSLRTRPLFPRPNHRLHHCSVRHPPDRLENVPTQTRSFASISPKHHNQHSHNNHQPNAHPPTRRPPLWRNDRILRPPSRSLHLRLDGQIRHPLDRPDNRSRHIHPRLHPSIRVQQLLHGGHLRRQIWCFCIWRIQSHPIYAFSRLPAVHVAILQSCGCGVGDEHTRFLHDIDGADSVGVLSVGTRVEE